MTAGSVHQILIGASRRDAITNMALNIQEALRKSVPRSDIHAFHGWDETIHGSVRMIDDLGEGSADDIIVYHSSYGIPELTPVLLARPERLVLAYHNITPASYYETIDPEFAEGLAWGRRELSMLRDKVVATVADSAFNARELEELGYRHVNVVPAGVRPDRLDQCPTDASFKAELTGHFPDGYILFVSQVLPHKRVELALSVIHLLRAHHGLDIGLVVAGPAHRPVYKTAIERFRALLPEAHVLFTGAVTDEQLATLYRGCAVFLGTSDHEGLAVPPLEAMSAGAPVVVRGCGAVPDTVGAGAFVVPPSAGTCELAGVVARVIQDADLADALRSAGRAHLSGMSRSDPTEGFMRVIEPLLS